MVYQPIRKLILILTQVFMYDHHLHVVEQVVIIEDEGELHQDQDRLQEEQLVITEDVAHQGDIPGDDEFIIT